MRLTMTAKAVLALFIVGCMAIGIHLQRPGLFGQLWHVIVVPEQLGTSKVPRSAPLPNVPDVQASSAAAVSLPGSEPGCADLPEVRMLVWAWNAQMGLMLANGGPRATKDSLMCKHGVNLVLERQDDGSKMQASLAKFADGLNNGQSNPSDGDHFVAIMGDGAGAFLAGLNGTLKSLKGGDLIAQVVGSAGYSRGEDALMGLPAWKENPKAAKGGLIAGVLRDGDWNIAMKWAADNELCNNPDEKTYDKGCLNWVAVDTYVDAAQKYVANYCEDRRVVSGGKLTGESAKVCVNGVVTWTPGDVTVAEERGGLVKIVSTKEYRAQMPNVLIGIKGWMTQHRPLVEGMLAALTEAGDMVKRSPEALDRAAEISAQVYKEKDAKYWRRYYRGAIEPDRKGIMVSLGGSSVNNLADNAYLFGLLPGTSNLFKATYTVFGDIVVQQYPKLVPSYPPTDEILDTSYLKALLKQMPLTKAEVPTFKKGEKIKKLVSRRNWHINFETGSATFTPGTMHDLNTILNSLLIAGGTIVQINGHTDNVGDPNENMSLSKQRAQAVQRWLEQKSPKNFPPGRIAIHAYGQSKPLVSNATEAGRARNRRVEIVLGTAT